MSEEKPTLLSIGRDKPYENFVAIFQISPDAGTISIKLPSDTAEEHLLEVARDHFHRLMQATADATKDWILADDRRQEIDPARKPRTGFATRRSSGSGSSGGPNSWMGN